MIIILICYIFWRNFIVPTILNRFKTQNKDPLGNLGFSTVNFKIVLPTKTSTSGLTVFSLGLVLIFLSRFKKKNQVQNS